MQIFSSERNCETRATLPQLNSPQQLNFRLSAGISCFHPLYIRTYVRDKYACGNFGEIGAITIVIYSPRGRRICFPKSRNILERSRLTSNNFSTIFRFCKFGIEARMLIKSERSGWMIKRFRLTRILQGIIVFYSHVNVNVAVGKFVNFDFKHFLNLEFNFSFPFRNLTSRRNKFGRISISIELHCFCRSFHLAIHVNEKSVTKSDIKIKSSFRSYLIYPTKNHDGDIIIYYSKK